MNPTPIRTTLGDVVTEGAAMSLRGHRTIDGLLLRAIETHADQDTTLVLTNGARLLVYVEDSRIILAAGEGDAVAAVADLSPDDALEVARHLIRYARAAGKDHRLLPAVEVLLSDCQEPTW